MVKFLMCFLVMFVASTAHAQKTLSAELEQFNDNVQIMSLDPLGELAASGVREKDIIIAINGLPVRYVVQVDSLLNKLQQSSSLVLLVKRHGVVFPINIQRGQTHKALQAIDTKNWEDPLKSCVLKPTVECAKDHILNVRYKQANYQLLLHADNVRFLIEAGRIKLAEAYAKKAIELYVKQSKTAPLSVNKAMIVMLKRLKRDVPSVWLNYLMKGASSSPRKGAMYLMQTALSLVEAGYAKHALALTDKASDMFDTWSDESKERFGADFIEKYTLILGKANMLETLDEWKRKNEDVFQYHSVAFYRGMLKAASQHNNLQLFAKGMNEGMAVAINAAADRTSEMAQMIVKQSWYAGNFKGVEYVTNWLVQFVDRYPKSQHYVKMVYALSQAYAISGNFTQAEQLIDEKLSEKYKNWRFQGLLRAATLAAKSRGAGVVTLNETRNYAYLLDRVYHYIVAMHQQNITSVKGLEDKDFEDFFRIYAALNGKAFRVTAYKDGRYTPSMYRGIVSGLLEVGQLELALDWAERMNERFPDERITKRVMREVFSAYGMFASIKLDSAILRSPVAKDYMNHFRRSRFTRLYWTGDFDRAADLVPIITNAKRMIVKQGVFIRNQCAVCQ